MLVAGCGSLSTGDPSGLRLDPQVRVGSGDRHTTLTGQDGDSSARMGDRSRASDVVGGSKVGGDGDSVGLWLAIAALGLQPITVILGGYYYLFVIKPRRYARMGACGSGTGTGRGTGAGT